MKRRGAYVSKFAAAAMLAGMAHAAAFAQTAPESVSPEPTSATTTITTSSIIPAPGIPVGVIGGLGGAFILAGLYGVYRGQRGAAFFTATGVAITAAMLNVQNVTLEQEQLPTDVVILVDRSASQSLGDRTSVTNTTLTNLTQKLAAFPGISIRISEIGSGETNIVSEIQSLSFDTGAVFALTDGQAHDADMAGNIDSNIPIHVLVSGHREEFDRRIVVEQFPRFGMIDESQKIRIRLEDNGNIPSGKNPVPVTISQDGKILRTVAVIPGAVTDISVTLPKNGENVFLLETAEIKGELTPLNNRALVSVEGLRPRMNVLIISGSPDHGQRNLHDLFKSDSNVKLVHFSTLRKPEKQDATPLKELALSPFPAHEIFGEAFNTVDLIVLNRYEDIGLVHMPYLDRIVERVRQGAGLMVISGPEYAGEKSLYNTPLAKILPASPNGKVTENTFRPDVTETGKRHPATRHLAGEHGVWHRSIDTTSQPATIMMQTEGGKPLLVMNREKKGRVAMLLSDQAWLWARGHDGGGPYSGLIGNTARWLLQDSTMEEESLRIQSRDNTLVVEQQTMDQNGSPVMIRTPSGKALTLETTPSEPGLWQAIIPTEEHGIYSAESTGRQLSKVFAYVEPSNPREFESPISTLDILRPLSKKSGGIVTRMVDDSGAAIDIKIAAQDKPGETTTTDKFNIRMNTKSITTGEERQPVIPDYLMLAGIIGLFGAGLYRHSEMSFFAKKKDRKDTPQP